MDREHKDLSPSRVSTLHVFPRTLVKPSTCVHGRCFNENTQDVCVAPVMSAQQPSHTSTAGLSYHMDIIMLKHIYVLSVCAARREQRGASVLARHRRHRTYDPVCFSRET